MLQHKSWLSRSFPRTDIFALRTPTREYTSSAYKVLLQPLSSIVFYLHSNRKRVCNPFVRMWSKFLLLFFISMFFVFLSGQVYEFSVSSVCDFPLLFRPFEANNRWTWNRERLVLSVSRDCVKNHINREWKSKRKKADFPPWKIFLWVCQVWLIRRRKNRRKGKPSAVWLRLLIAKREHEENFARFNCDLSVSSA